MMLRTNHFSLDYLTIPFYGSVSWIIKNSIYNDKWFFFPRQTTITFPFHHTFLFTKPTWTEPRSEIQYLVSGSSISKEASELHVNTAHVLSKGQCSSSYLCWLQRKQHQSHPGNTHHYRELEFSPCNFTGWFFLIGCVHKALFCAEHCPFPQTT